MMRISALQSLLPVLLASISSLALAGCDPDVPPPHRIDLTEIEPRVETLDGEPTSIRARALLPGRRAWETASADPDGVWILDQALGGGWKPPIVEGRELILGSQVRTILHPEHLRLVWSLELPDSAHLSLRLVVPTRADECSTGHMLTLEFPEDQPHFLAWYTTTSADSPLGPVEDVHDLSRWAGRTVDLVFEGQRAERTGSGEECRNVVGWHSPAIWSDMRPEMEEAPTRGKGQPPSVLLLGLGTVRADHLGAWGRHPSPTPALDRLAEQSDVFGQAYSTFNVTTPSFVSIQSGLYGKHHGVYRLGTPASEEIRTLAEIFSDAGYVTQAVLAATHLGAEASGLGQGFDGVHAPWGQWAAEEVVRRGLGWLGEVEGAGAPFFLWLHFFDPHTPQTPPLPYSSGKAPAEVPGLAPIGSWRKIGGWFHPHFADPSIGAQPRLYDDELAYMDRQIGRLMDLLDRRGVLDHTWVVVVADHGENLGEHGLVCRHAGLWDTTTHVPLMIRPPGPWTGDATRSGERFEGLVQTVDLFPTLLRRLGLQIPPSDGEDLYELAERGGRPAVFAEQGHAAGAMVRTADHLLYRHQGSEEAGDDGVEPGVYLYDLADDPAQERNLAGRGMPAEEELLRRLDAWLADRSEAHESGPSALDEAEKEQPRALGYVN